MLHRARRDRFSLLLCVNRTVPRWFPESLCVRERGNAKRYKLAPQRGVPVHYVILSRRRKTITTSDVCREWLSRSRRVLPASNARESTLYFESKVQITIVVILGAFHQKDTECFSAIDTALHSITHWIVTSLLFATVEQSHCFLTEKHQQLTQWIVTSLLFALLNEDEMITVL